MKKIYLTLALLIFVIAIKAQGPPPPQPPSLEERMKKLAEVMKKEVNTNDKQQAAINEAFKIFFAGADQVRKNDPPPPPPPPDPKVKAAMDKLEKDRDEAVRKVLSAEQFEKYRKAAEKMKPPAPPRDK